MWGAEASAGDRPLFPETHGGTGAEAHWETARAGPGAGKQLWPQRGGHGGTGASTALSSGRAGKVSPALVFALAEVKERTAAGARVPAPSPDKTRGRHVWDKVGTLGEGHEETMPTAFRRLRLSNGNKQVWVFESGQRTLPSESHGIAWSLRAET